MVPNGEEIPLGDIKVILLPNDNDKEEAKREPIITCPLAKLLLSPNVL